MTFDAHRDRTALRLRLYSGGFTPLANKRKLCLVPQWNSLDVTPDLINSREWARSKAFPDTGIRCGDVVALDWDIDDKDLLNELLDEIVEQGIVPESPFVRIGMPPRELWVYRAAEKIGKRTTGHFMPPNPPEGHKGFAVEVLGAGCQFAAYGQRDDVTDYSWPVESLADHQYMDLPEITKAQADAVKDFAVAFFERHGLERKSPAGGTDEGYSHAYDLTPDMVFDVQDMGLMTVAEIAEALTHSPKGEVLRCKVDALRPTTGSWAGMISLVDGAVCVSDHGTYTSHFPVEGDTGKALERLGALLAERFPEPVAGPPGQTSDIDFDLTSILDPLKPLDDNLALALKRFVYIEEGNTIHDIRRPLAGMTADHFRTRMKQFYEVRPGPRGGEQRAWLSDLWTESKDRINVGSIAMRPDQPWPLFREDGLVHLNLYRPQALPDNLGDASVGFEFIERLLPIEAERNYFLRWLSYKYQNPAARGPGIVMVAHDRYGTGRGTLVELLREMFSSGLVQNVDFKTLSGQTYQSQYNEWLADNLIIAVDEAQEAAPSLSKWQTRSNAYEHIKSIVDPAVSHITVTRKGARNFAGRTFASTLIFTNHYDAVIIPNGDRRLAILENGQPQTQEYWTGVYAWIRKPENIAAFVKALVEIPLGDYSPYAVPMMTAAKAEMISAGTSELDRALEHALTGLADTLIVKEQIILRIEDYLSDNTVEVPDDWQRMVERMLFRKTRKPPAGAPERVRIEGKQRVLRVLGKVDAGVFTSAENVLLEIAKNGLVTRQIRSSGQVVSFPQKRG